MKSIAKRDLYCSLWEVKSYTYRCQNVNWEFRKNVSWQSHA